MLGKYKLDKNDLNFDNYLPPGQRSWDVQRYQEGDFAPPDWVKEQRRMNHNRFTAKLKVGQRRLHIKIDISLTRRRRSKIGSNSTKQKSQDELSKMSSLDPTLTMCFI